MSTEDAHFAPTALAASVKSLAAPAAKAVEPNAALGAVPGAPLVTAQGSEYDVRLQWLQQKIESTLFLEPASAKGSSNSGASRKATASAHELFVDCLERDERKSFVALTDYLEGRAKSSAVVFWTDHVTVKTLVPVEAPAEPAALAPATSTAALATPVPESDSNGQEPNALTETAEATEAAEATAEAEAPETAEKAAPLWESHEELRMFMALQQVPPRLEQLNAVYFLRNVSGRIDTPRTLQDAEHVLDRDLEMGYFSGHALLMLEGLLSEVYLPVLSAVDFRVLGGSRSGASPAVAPAAEPEATPAASSTTSSKTDSLKSEFLVNTQKFLSSLSNTAQQVVAQKGLKIPEEDLLILMGSSGENFDYAAATSRPETVRLCEDLISEWVESMTQTIERESKKTPVGPGALAEVTFWRDRYTVLSTLYEQLTLPIVSVICAILRHGGTANVAQFETRLAELTKMHMEAKDNVKFLSTLERHFKNILVGSLGNVQDSLPSLLNAIRMVWIISRHYNQDERMVPLMARIAHDLCSRVSAAVNPKTVFQQPPGRAKQVILEGKSLLQAWSTTYFAVRERIEQSGRDQRWEFDRKKLFEQTTYMAQRCGDLFEIADIISEFHNIFGVELKQVTGDSMQIDEILGSVSQLSRPFEAAPFDIYSKRYQTAWETLMQRFREHVAQIEEMAKGFIDASFKKLRSAEGAFDLLQNIKSIKSRESINRQLMSKWYEILEQYSFEVEEVERLFTRKRASPPISKSLPRVAGSIEWSRSLFFRIKRTILRFQSLQELISTTQGRAVTRKYLAVAKTMREYEKDLYQRWCQNVEANAGGYLKAHLLVCDGGSGPAATATPTGASAANTGAAVQTALGSLRVNFRPELEEIVREARYLDRLGFAVPELAMNIALQAEKYEGYAEALEDMAFQCRTLVGSLDSMERRLLVAQMQEVQRVLGPGLSRLNWNSLGIRDYIGKCNHELNGLASLVGQVKKNSASINRAIEAIAGALLVREPRAGEAASSAETGAGTEANSSGALPDAHVFFNACQQQCDSAMEEVVRKHASIAPLVVKMESLVANTSTGRSPLLQECYLLWEKKILAALNFMIMSNLRHLEELLSLNTAGPGRPVLALHASLSAPEIVVAPVANEVYKLIIKLARSVVDSSKHIYRWQNGSCIRTPPQRLHEDEEPITFTLYAEVLANHYIVQQMSRLNQRVVRSFQQLTDYLDQWRKYRPLWKVDKAVTLEKFAAKRPSVVHYDEKLMFYAKLARDVEQQAVVRDLGFIRVLAAPLRAAVHAEAQLWIESIGAHLAQTARTETAAIAGRIDAFSARLEAEPAELSDLTAVLQTIAEVHDATEDAERQYLTIGEMHRTLRMYGISVADEERELADGLAGRWQGLLALATATQRRLGPIKLKFTEVTRTRSAEFVKDLGAAVREIAARGPATIGQDLDAAAVALAAARTTVQQLQERFQALNQAEKLFDLAATPAAELFAAEAQLSSLERLLGVYADFKGQLRDWAATPWVQVDLAALTAGAEGFSARLTRLGPDCGSLPAFATVNRMVSEFRGALPLLGDLKHEALRGRHWAQLLSLATGAPAAAAPSGEAAASTGDNAPVANAPEERGLPEHFTLERLLALNLGQHGDAVSEIVAGAIKELGIENGLVEIATTWQNMKFSVSKYTRGGAAATATTATAVASSDENAAYILGSLEAVTTALDDGTMNLQSMAASRYAAAFAAGVGQWERSLSLIGEVTEVWAQVQRKWMYLESIFIGGDLRQQLPEEAARFDGVDKAFRKVMAEVAKNSSVLEACGATGRLELFQGLFSELERCQKSLAHYLESKRHAFPRFYFISDEELLSILGNADPGAVQEHVIKMYDNVQRLVFGSGRYERAVVGMASSEGEELPFRTAVPAEGRVEEWMCAVTAEMKTTNHIVHKTAVFEYAGTDRSAWISKFPGMVGLAGSQVWWTWDVQDVFSQIRQGDKLAMKRYSGTLGAQLEQLVVAVRSDLTANERRKMNAQIIVDVHARDIVDLFVRDSIMDASEFEWESQLRFYWERDADTLVVRQCNGSFQYGFEYMGLNGRLVITPLTDRCYLTLTQALSLRLGGAPAGPAGTGKTETVKDLAKALGLLCVVTNCGEGMDYRSMGTSFSGVVQTGAWGCFDEFNRIDLEVLSVVAAQIKTIQNALAMGLRRFQFEGSEIALEPTVGLFITMNPGYAGRTELPDNLKSLFRPVVMAVPDLELICEIMLFSEGFTLAKPLAKKMVVLYRLARGQLSKQHHYDFGLRALKSVLVMAGGLKRGSPDLPEDVVLMRALRDMNLPKFVYDDVPLFLGLVQDLFPGLECPRVRYPQFHAAVEGALSEQGYVAVPAQADKVVQLYETMMTRHSTIVVGPSGGGKTVVMEALCRAQTKCGQPTRTYVMNPKAVTVNELYGVLNPLTRDWTDGLLSSLFRELNRPLPSERAGTAAAERRYIVFDGDVDAVWIENMNSVMDDNRLLTLANGERIRLQKHVALLFEVGDLQYASPATVSRCGMVYVDPKDLGAAPYFTRWAAATAAGRSAGAPAGSATEQLLLRLYEKYVPALLELLFEGTLGGFAGEPLSLPVPMTPVAMVAQLCLLLGATHFSGTTDAPATDGATGAQAVEAAMVEALVWSLGAAVRGESDRTRFSDAVKQLAEAPLVSVGHTVPLGQLPGDGRLLYDWHYDGAARQWVPWTRLVPEFVADPSVPFFDRIVPTADLSRHTWLVERVAGANRRAASLLVGDPGTAKTVTVQRFLQGLPSERNATLTLALSSRTSSLDVQRALEANVEKRTKDTYGPAAGRRLMAFVDNLNMPQVDRYGTQQPLALLKQLLDRGGLYDRGKELNWKYLKDVQLVAAMGTPGGGRHAIDPRLAACFCVFYVDFPSAAALSQIYGTLVSSHLVPFSASVSGLATPVAAATLAVYRAVRARLPATPRKFHYVFNLRDIGRVVQGVLRSTPDVVTDATGLARLWRYETLRVFRDRLIGDADRVAVDEIVAASIHAELGGVEEGVVLEDPLIYGDLVAAPVEQLDEAEESETVEGLRLYRPLDLDGCRAAAQAALNTYNGSSGPAAHGRTMNLVLFDEALEHLMRIHRAIRAERGHALLVGDPGSGKQSLTRLAAFMAGFRVYEIQLARGYGETEFRQNIQEVYRMVVCEGQHVVFLFTDAHVVHESFLELVNSMLTTGLVASVYADADEREQLVGGLREAATAAGGEPPTRETLWARAEALVAARLHLVLCMSPQGDTLRERCRSFPALVNNTAIDWFTAWPAQALRAVAEAFLAADADAPDGQRTSIVEHMVLVHESVGTATALFLQTYRRVNHVSPRAFLDYIRSYNGLLAQQREDHARQCRRLESGLSKLHESAQQLDVLSRQLAEQNVAVRAKTEACNALLEVIAASTKEAEEKKALADRKAGELEVQNVQIARDKGEAEIALAEALPALEEARLALNNLSASEITEIRSFAKPPREVQKVCECICVIKGIKDVSWKSAKGMMSQTDFKSSLSTMDVDAISAAQVKQVKQILREMDVSVERMLEISSAGAGLLKFVLAVVGYCNVARTIQPKRQAVAQLERNLAISQAEFDRITREVQALTVELGRLQSDFGRAKSEQLELQEMAELMARRLSAADKLISGLGSEKVRWAAELERLHSGRAELVGNCLLVAAFLSYTGAFNSELRSSLLYDTWRGDLLARSLPMTETLRAERLLATDVMLSQWAFEGLPQDELSVQNGVLTTRGSRFPLCIDPQCQALAWIRRREAGNNLHVSSFSEPDFVKQLEMAIAYGFPFLLQDVDEYIDPVIEPVLEKDIRTNGARRFVRLGDKDVDYDPNFRLYLTTRAPNPRFGPKVFACATVINYSLTFKGLSDQLLNVVVRHERRDLEETREQLVRQVSASSTLLSELEDTLLRELAMSQGSMLDNAELIRTLEETKAKSSEIAAQLAQASRTAVEVDASRDLYRPAARIGAVLFFVLKDLAAMNPMYEYSLAAFLDVFGQSLHRSRADPAVAKRLANIVDTLKTAVYSYACAGLFERHKLVFSFQLATRLLDADGQLDSNELLFFLRGDVSLDQPAGAPARPAAVGIPEYGWKDLLRLQTVATDNVFAGLADNVRANASEWRAWAQSEAPETTPLPAQFRGTPSPFQRLCLLRCFRADRIVNGATQFVSAAIGERFVVPPVVSYQAIYEQSSPTAPVVFVLSPGADPQSELASLADRLGFGGTRLKFLSLGQGQGPLALQLLDVAATRGHWLMLQNCHLLVNWLRTLEKALDKMEKPHRDFRLWLTTEPTPQFPIGILQRAFKVVTEPPSGLRLNLRSTIAKMPDDAWHECAHPAYTPLVFVLAFFHAVVQERGKYGKIGWNVRYDFNDSDFRVSQSILGTYLGKSASDGTAARIPWNTLKYLLGQVIYGGRVTDDYDRRIVKTYLDEYMGDFLFDSLHPFAFYAGEHCSYTLPPSLAERQDALAHVETLPLANPPEVLGLHPQAEVSYLTAAAHELWTHLINMQPQAGPAGAGASREDAVAEIARDLAARIAAPFDVRRVNKTLGAGGALSPTQVVLVQELEYWNALVDRMTTSLHDLQRAHRGEIGMSLQLDDLANALYNGVLPALWRPLAPQTSKSLPAWMLHFEQRYAQFAAWVKTGEPLVIWLAGLLVPEAYLAALVQQSCRKNGWSLDRSTLYTVVTDTVDPAAITERPPSGCYVQGLFLEGAAWDLQRACLRRCGPSEGLVQPLPILRIIPIESFRLKLLKTFRTPVYVTPQRRNAAGTGWVFDADLVTADHSSHWTLQGVCLLLNTST